MSIYIHMNLLDSFFFVSLISLARYLRRSSINFVDCGIPRRFFFYSWDHADESYEREDEVRKREKTFFLDIKIQIIKNQDPSRPLIQKINIYFVSFHFVSSSFTSILISSTLCRILFFSIYIILCSSFYIFDESIIRRNWWKKKVSLSMKRVE